MKTNHSLFKLLAAILVSMSTAALANPEIELGYVNSDKLELRWNDAGSGADRNGSFYAPTVPAGSDWHVLAHIGFSGYTPTSGMVVGKALTPTAFLPPVNFFFIYDDSKSGADLDGCFWWPNAPPGYRSLGAVVNDCNGPPAVTSVMTVRKDLVVQGGMHGDLIYSDAGSGGFYDIAIFRTDCPAGSMDIGAFFTSSTKYLDDSTEKLFLNNLLLYCLKEIKQPAPSNIEELLQNFGPRIIFHPAEEWLPDDPSVILDDPATRLEWWHVWNEDQHPSKTDDPCPFPDPPPR